MTPYLTTRPVRATLAWQAAVTLALAAAGGLWWGWDTGISALLGGLIVVIAGLAYAIVISISNSPSVETTLRTMVMAEAAKIATIVLSMWAAISSYRELDGAAFFGAFVIAVLLHRVAFLIRKA